MSAPEPESKVRKAQHAARAEPRVAWWLPGPHLPTIYGKLCRRIALPATVREQWPTPDGDVLSVERLAGQPGSPRMIILHGLEGGTHSSYARGLLTHARDRGWAADLVLWRTCDGEPVNRTRRAYHSGASDDADVAIRRIAHEDLTRPVVLVGVSLGGNVLLKWLGEQGEGVPANIAGAAAVSAPFDLAAASRCIERGFSAVYGRFFLKTLKAKTLAKLARFPDLVDARSVERAQTLWEFDDVVTGPIHGFADAADYYRRVSSIGFLREIRIPTLLLNAENDPFLPRSVLRAVRTLAEENPRLHCEFPAHGGHVGFITGPHPWRAEYWMETRVFEWLAACAGEHRIAR